MGTEVSADRPERPVLLRLLVQAFAEAKALDLPWVSTENFLLAILASKERPPARVALEECGVDHDAFASAFKRSIEASDPPVYDREARSSTATNPAAHELMGRAEGMAAGLGAPTVSYEHVLLAYLWDTSSDELEMLCGVTRTSVWERLRGLGVEMPAVPLPS